jgi:hypothetical protein
VAGGRYDDAVKRWSRSSSQPPTKRICVFLLLLLAWAAGGAIVNIAVAWGCAWWSLPVYAGNTQMTRSAFWKKPHQSSDVQPIVLAESFGVSEACILLTTSPTFPKRTLEEFAQSIEIAWQGARVDAPLNLFIRQVALKQSQRGLAEQVARPCLRVEAGWPLRSVRGWAAGYEPIQHGEVEDAIVLTRHVANMRAIRLLPYAPMWPGFAINTLFYAGTLWLLFAAPFALRRRRRIKRGLCPKCAYPIGRGGTSDVCTECGAAVPLSHRERGQG